MGKSKTTQQTSGTTQQQTQQQATPYAPIMPGMQQLGTSIGNAMTQAQGVPLYMGDMVAQGGALQNAVIPAMQSSAQFAQGMVPQFQNAANTVLNNNPVFSGPSINAGTQSFGSYDPSGVHSVIEAAIQPYMRQLTEQVLPGIQSSAIEAGAYGNDRAFAMLPGQAIRDTGRMASEVAAGVAYNDFQSQQQRLQNAYSMDTTRGLGASAAIRDNLAMFPELLNGAMNANMQGLSLTQEAANYDIAMRQAEINNALARDQYMVNAPFRGLDTAAGLYGAFAPYATQNATMNGSNQSTTTTTQQQALGPQLLQAGLGAASMFAGMPGGLGGLFGGAAASAANPLMNFSSAAKLFQPTPFNPNIKGW